MNEPVYPERFSFQTKNAAKRIRKALRKIIRDEGEASLADYYELLGIGSNAENEKYGWHCLCRTPIVEANSGSFPFMVDFPRVTKLNKENCR